jgi:hypothetical protein
LGRIQNPNPDVPLYRKAMLFVGATFFMLFLAVLFVVLLIAATVESLFSTEHEETQDDEQE